MLGVTDFPSQLHITLKFGVSLGLALGPGSLDRTGSFQEGAGVRGRGRFPGRKQMSYICRAGL